MQASVQVSIYPLRQPRLRPAIDAVRSAFEREGLPAEVGAMSTTARGDAERIFAALRAAFEAAGQEGDVSMVVTLSNACPASA